MTTTRHNAQTPTQSASRPNLLVAGGLATLLAITGFVWGATPALVPVEDAGNAADATGFGAVDHVFQIGVYEVTRAEYAAFLNAVAATDTHGLYNAKMGITRSGSPGAYAYTAVDGAKGVAYVSWFDTLRYANWLHNGQASGAQNATTTEDGAYTFSGDTVVSDRKSGARFFLPNENEWYKAAYYQGGTGGFFWQYPTRSDTPPVAAAPPGGDNSANYDKVVGTASEAGAYATSQGYYGTHDQAGSLWEWNESETDGDRGLRGGSYADYALLLKSWYRDSQTPGAENEFVGFRVAAVGQDSMETFTLAVNSGSGDGQYTPGTVVGIAADPAPAGKVFDRWTGGTVANPLASATRVTMPAAPLTLTATYRDAQAPSPTYSLSVQYGSGDGQYVAGTVVAITADAAPAGKVFDRWTGGTVANPLAVATTVTMPAAPLTLTATYKNASVTTFDMVRAEWSPYDSRLRVSGVGPKGKKVVVTDMAGRTIGTVYVGLTGKWNLKVKVASTRVPERVRATCKGMTDQMDVTRPPIDD